MPDHAVPTGAGSALGQKEITGLLAELSVTCNCVGVGGAIVSTVGVRMDSIVITFESAESPDFVAVKRTVRDAVPVPLYVSRGLANDQPDPAWVPVNTVIVMV